MRTTLIAFLALITTASTAVFANTTDTTATMPECRKAPKACQQSIEVALPDPGMAVDIKIDGTKLQIVRFNRTSTSGLVLMVRSLRPFRIGKWEIKGDSCGPDLELGRSCRALINLNNERYFDTKSDSVMIEIEPTKKTGQKEQYFRIGTLRQMAL